MPFITRLFIKTSFIYLMAALLLGLALAARSLWQLPNIIAAFGPVYFHLFMLGWVTQLIFGVVYWMLPKYTMRQPHGNEALWQTTFWLLNAGLLLRVAAEPAQSVSLQAFWGWGLALSAVLQWLAVMIFVFNSWIRVKGRR